MLKSLSGGMGPAIMKIMVTGGNGFVGSHLVEALLAEGHDVRCLLRPTSDRRWLEGLAYEEVTGSLDDEASLVRAVEGVEVVYHAAGATKARRPEELYRVNARGTANLAEACARRESPPRLIYVSSQAAAGPSPAGDCSSERAACRPVNAYGASKLEGEEEVRRRGAAVPFVIIRPSAVYGPRDTEMLLFFKFVRRGIEPRLGWEDRYVSLCYIDDLVEGLRRAARAEGAVGETYFLAHEEVWEWRGVARAAAAAMGVKTFPVRVPKAVLFGAATLAELAASLGGGAATLTRERARAMWEERWVCDVTKAKRELDFVPQTGFAAGAKLTTAWYRGQGWL